MREVAGWIYKTGCVTWNKRSAKVGWRGIDVTLSDYKREYNYPLKLSGYYTYHHA